MTLQRNIPAGGTDFTPEGVSRFLAHFSPTAKDVQARIGEFVTDPRAIIGHAFELTTGQRALLAETSDAELARSLEPVFQALRDGKALRVAAIQTVAQGVEINDAVVQTQQQAQKQIVITIGRGRCKITITIDL